MKRAKVSPPKYVLVRLQKYRVAIDDWNATPLGSRRFQSQLGRPAHSLADAVVRWLKPVPAASAPGVAREEE